MMKLQKYAETPEKNIFLAKNILEDENGLKKYRFCNESNRQYQIFNPQTDPF